LSVLRFIVAIAQSEISSVDKISTG
jgi:hypothetical protein